MEKKAEKSVERLNFDRLVDGKNFSVTISSREDSRESVARIRMEAEEAAHQRKKDLMFSRFAIGFFTVLVILCCWAIIRSAPYADKAMTMLMSLATGLVGYLFGKFSNQK